MATYYRWRQSQPNYSEEGTPVSLPYNVLVNSEPTTYYASNSVQIVDGELQLISPSSFTIQSGQTQSANFEYISVDSTTGTKIFSLTNPEQAYFLLSKSDQRRFVIQRTGTGSVTLQRVDVTPGTLVGYVYSTSSSAYPNGGVQGDYYYDQRTTITSPTAPTGLTYPNPIVTSSADVSWTASVTNVPIYAVSTYEVSYSTNGGSTWTVAGTTADTSLNVDLPAGATSIQFRVRAKDSNGQWSSYATGTASNILLSPTLTVPSMAMQGQQITVNWTAIDGATSYTLQRQANTDDGWVQVYSGNALTFTETVGTWTTVQYQVQAVFSSGAGGWATSDSIPVVSAAALVISGQDEDLGLITHDVPYTVSTDTGNPISLTRTVNGVQVASLTVENGFAYDIPVMDLPTGEGTIVISASVNTSGGSPVTATRTWTYTKTEFSFPNVGSTAQLTLQGENVFPATLAECVRVGANLGGDLGHALEMIAPLVLNGAQMYVDSYVGTGTSGQDNPTELVFPFVPDLWGYIGLKTPSSTTYNWWSVFIPWGTESIDFEVGGDLASASYLGSTVSFYSDGATYQENSNGYTYYFVGIKIG